MTRRVIVLTMISLPAILSSARGMAAPTETIIHRNLKGTLGAGVALSKTGEVFGFAQHPGDGVVYKLTRPKSGTDTYWHKHYICMFPKGGDVALPYGQPFFDEEGALYGITLKGGAHKDGTIFRLTPSASAGGLWMTTILFSFPHHGGSYNYYVPGSLTLGAGGVLYGTTLSPTSGGQPSCTTNCGSAFSLTPPDAGQTAWTYRTLYSFGGGADGDNPASPLVQDSAGVLYGTTKWGGSDTTSCRDGRGCGTVFALIPPAQKRSFWTKELLYTFPPSPAGGDGPQGGEPIGALTLGQAGLIFGNTEYAGQPCLGGGAGVAFELTPPTGGQPSWSYSVVHTFVCTDGANPNGGMLVDPEGTLIGATENYPIGFGGSVFKLRPPRTGQIEWPLSTIYGFRGSPSDGARPLGPVTAGRSGALFGTTQDGGDPNGAIGFGVTFEIAR